jgi:hypothetical protein
MGIGQVKQVDERNGINGLPDDDWLKRAISFRVES